MNKNKKVIAVCASMAAVLATGIFIRFTNMPFIWIGLAWMVCLSIVFWSLDSGALRVTVANLCAALLALTLFECYLWLKIPTANSRYDGVYEGYYKLNHSYLGYAPNPNVVRPSAKKYFGEVLLYDVTYTIGENGLRITRYPENHTDKNGSIAIFGGSFAFGEGVGDEQSMPFQVALLRDTFDVYNFGLHGYGPHQMLSALQHGLVTDIIGETNRAHFVYQYVPHHVNRASGLTSWDNHGPRYKLDSDGNAVYSGHFDDGIFSGIDKEMGKSLIYRKVFGTDRALKDGDIDLFVAIVNKAKEITGALYPGSTFDVISWGNGESEQALIKLKNKGLRIHSVSDILPEYSKNRTQYVIENDGHPSALAHRIIARYVADKIVQ